MKLWFNNYTTAGLFVAELLAVTTTKITVQMRHDGVVLLETEDDCSGTFQRFCDTNEIVAGLNAGCVAK